MKYLKHSIENLLNNVVEHRTSPRISTFTVLNLFCLHIAEQRPLEGSPAVVTILRERFCFMLCPDPPVFLQSHLVGRKKCRGWMSLRLTDAPARKWTEAAFFGWKTAKAGSSWPSICQRKQFCWCTLLLKGRGVFKLKYSSVLRTIKNLTKTAHVFSNWQFSLSSKRQSLKTARQLWGNCVAEQKAHVEGRQMNLIKLHNFISLNTGTNTNTNTDTNTNTSYTITKITNYIYIWLGDTGKMPRTGLSQSVPKLSCIRPQKECTAQKSVASK